MLQTLRPCSARTAEIMARYRPIAPRPEVPSDNLALTRVLPHLHARPSRTRKRGRTSLGPPFSGKRLRSGYLQGLLSPPNYQFSTLTPPPPRPVYVPPVTTLAGLENPATIVTIPLLPQSSPEPNVRENGVFDLNKPALEEKDFLRQLESPTATAAGAVVITPLPVRLVSSTITIWSIKEEPKPGPPNQVQGDSLEEEVESKDEPVVVTDSKNRVRAVSSAYKELVGQPECLWLDTVGRCGTACKRICGEVILRVVNSDLPVPVLSKGFSGQAQIEWESIGKKRFVDMFFDATKLYCESKDYQFAWRFYNLEASQSY